MPCTLPHLTVAAIAERDGRFLLVEEEAEGRRVFNQPAGHVEPGEDPRAAVVRETLEETGWDFAPGALVGFYAYRSPTTGRSYLRVCFSGTAVRHWPERPLDPEIRAVWWLDETALAQRAEQLRSPMVLRCIRDYRAGCRYPLSLLTNLIEAP